MLLGVVVVCLLVAQRLMSMSFWAPLLIVVVLSVTMVGDLATYIRSRRELRKALRRGDT